MRLVMLLAALGVAACGESSSRIHGKFEALDQHVAYELDPAHFHAYSASLKAEGNPHGLWLWGGYTIDGSQWRASGVSIFTDEPFELSGSFFADESKIAHGAYRSSNAPSEIYGEWIAERRETWSWVGERYRRTLSLRTDGTVRLRREYFVIDLVGERPLATDDFTGTATIDGGVVKIAWDGGGENSEFWYLGPGALALAEDVLYRVE